MADSKLKLPGSFSPGKNYLMRGETLLAWRTALLADRVLPGSGLSETQGPDGRIFEAAAGGGGAIAGAFQRVYQASAKWWLQGGQVSGGTGNEVVADIELGTVGSEPADGTLFWVKATGSGTVTEGILYGGFEVTGASAHSGTALPANTLPTVATATVRKFYLLLGTWNDDVFSASAGGNVGVTFCPGGGYSISRF